MRKIRLPVEVAKEFGFVPHGRAFPNVDALVDQLPPEKMLPQSPYPYFFAVDIEPTTAKSTLQLFANAKAAGRDLKAWTAFTKQLKRKRGSAATHYRAFYAFSNEEDAIWARLSFE